MDENTIEEYQIPVYRDCSEELNGWRLFSFSLCYDGSFLFFMTKEALDYCRILHLNAKGDCSHEVQIQFSQFDYAERRSYTIELLPGDRFLLVSSRCPRYDDGTTQCNGRIFDKAGNLVSKLVLGDGINKVQTDKDGFIWTSYFDEGIFGNYGWEPSNAIGASGLVKWNDRGEVVYEYTPNHSELDSICDCYTMNIVNENELWISYYTQFPLVKISNLTVTDYWLHDLGSISNLLVNGNKLLVSAGYGNANVFSLLELKDKPKRVECLRKLRITCQNHGTTESQTYVFGSYRDSKMAFFKNNKLYLFDMKDID